MYVFNKNATATEISVDLPNLSTIHRYTDLERISSQFLNNIIFFNDQKLNSAHPYTIQFHFWAEMNLLIYCKQHK